MFRCNFRFLVFFFFPLFLFAPFKIARADSPKPASIFTGHQARIVYIIGVDSAGDSLRSVLSIDATGKLLFWDIDSLKISWEAQVGPNTLDGQAFITTSSNGKFAAVIRANSPVNIYDVQTGIIIQTLKAAEPSTAPSSPREGLFSFGAFSPDSRRFAISTDDNNILIFDLETGLQNAATDRPYRYDSPHGGAISFSKDGLTLVVATYSPESYAIYDATTLETLKSIKMDIKEYTEGHRFSNDMRLLAIATKSSIIIVNSETLETIYSIKKPVRSDHTILDTFDMAFDRRSLQLHVWYVLRAEPYPGQYQIINVVSGETILSATIDSPVFNPPDITGSTSTAVCLVPSANLVLSEAGQSNPNSIAIWNLPSP